MKDLGLTLAQETGPKHYNKRHNKFVLIVFDYTPVNAAIVLEM